MTAPSVTPEQVEQLLAGGADPHEVVRLLVATGAWTKDGATEIVSTFATGGVALAEPAVGESWPGPFEEVPPLFAS